MKKRIINLLVLALVLLLGFTFTGCSSDNGNAADAPDTNSAKKSDVPDTNSTKKADTSEFADFESVDWASIGKYKVKELNNEITQNGVYTLGYASNEKTDKIVNYFDELLEGTQNYLLKEIPTIGALLKGTINGHGITVSVQYDDSGDTTLVEFYSYDASMVAK